MLPVSAGFASPLEFMHFFASNERLEVEPEVPLIIRNYDKNVLSDTSINSSCPHCYLSRLLHPIGKILSIIPSKFSHIEMIDNDLFVKFADKTILQAEIGTIKTRLSELFTQMLKTSHANFSLAAGQKLKIQDIEEEEFYTGFNSTMEECLHAIFKRALPYGMEIKYTHIEKVSWKRAVEGGFENRIVTIWSDKFPVNFHLREIYTFYADAFIHRLGMGLDYVLPAGTPLIIKLEHVEQFLKKIKLLQPGIQDDKYKLAEEFVLFLSFFASFLVKRVLFHIDIQSISITIKDNAIKLESAKQAVFSLIDAPPLITPKVLGFILQKNHISSISIKNKLVLFSENTITENEAKTLGKILLYDAPFGCIFTLQGNGLMYRTKYPQALMIKPHGEMQLKLHILSKAALIKIITDRQPALKSLLEERDSNGFVCLLFQLFIEYCYRHVGSFPCPLPNYFKETTSFLLLSLMNDGNFISSWNEMLSNDGLAKRFQEIVTLDPNEFSLLDKEKEEKPIQFILSNIGRVVYHELQNSTFLASDLL